MTPEEEYREELKWILQKIKKELLHAENLVDFNASRLTNRDPDSPSLDAIYKHLKDLERATVIRIVERYDDDDFSAYAYSFDAGAGVTGYKFIVDREKFATLYEKYFKPRPVENDKSFDFESEKRDIAAIDSADEYKIITDKWFNIKQILDALFKLLSPIDMNEAQTVTLNPKYLPDGQKRLFTSVISDMVRAGVIGGTHEITPPVVVTSALATSVTSGKYIPLKVAVFKAYRKKVSDLVAWIENDRAKFSKSGDGVVKKESEKREGGIVTDDSVPEEGEDDCFSYDGGPSAPYPNTDSELFILKKILLEHKHRDDGGFNAKELSFNNNSLADICRPIQLMIEDKILYLSGNTFPERSGDDKDDGIEDKRGFINWKVVEKLDKNPSEIDAVAGGVNFDTDIQDEVKLKGRLDIAIEEFMNDKVQNPDGFAYGMDKSKLEEALARNKKEPNEEKRKWIDENFVADGSSYLYAKQREIIISELTNRNAGEMVMPLNGFRDKSVDVLKTLLALEKENILRIKELQSNTMFDNDGNFIGLWATKDNPVAKIQILNVRASGAIKPRTKAGKDTSLASEKENLVGELPFATKPEFDEKKSRIMWNGHPCEIPINENSYFFCRRMFVPGFGEKVSELDISEQDEWVGGSPRSVYNAMNWVNGLIKGSYGIENDLFKTRKNYFWIRDELFKSP
jgi:hypothetical protein